MIRAIFFDYDGVLTTDKSGSLTTFRYLSEASCVAFSAISAAFSPYSADLFTGRVGYAQIWRKACEAMGKELDFGLLAGAFESTPQNKSMFSLAQGLRANYAVGIITDNSRDRMNHLRKQQRLDSLFSPIIVSADVGSGKHGEEIFLRAISCASVSPEESIFIDNSEANLIVARALGMHAVFHDDEKNDVNSLTKELRLLGARVDDD